MITDKLYRSLSAWPGLQRQFARVVKRLPHRRRQVSRYGQILEIDPSEMAGFYLYYEQDYDNYLFEFLSTQVSKFERALDIGAHHGIYTVFLAARIPHVDAFEPDPENADRLEANLKRNHLGQVVVHRACVGLQTGEVHFRQACDVNQGVGSITLDAGGSVSRPCVSLDDFFNDSLPGSCLIKMDIEGGEWLAFQGAQRVFKSSRFPLAILLEVHPEDIARLGGSVEKFANMLNEMGLKISALTPQGLKPLSAGNNFRFWWVTNF